MPEHLSDNGAFLRNGDVVNIGISLPDRIFAEDLATVATSESGDILLSLFGNGFPKHLPIPAGSRVIIAKGEGRSLFHGTATLKDSPGDNTIRINSLRNITVKDRQKHLRTDVIMPVNYRLPASQHMGKIISEWEGIKEYHGKHSEDAEPDFPERGSHVNLSSSGLRFNIHDCLSYGTLLHLRIELPGEEPDHLHAIGSIVRTKELIPDMMQIEYYSTLTSFRMIESSDRLKLMKHVLKKQRKNCTTPPASYLITSAG